MNILIPVLLVLGAFFFMEFMAWFTHKYIMHGFGWLLHKDHHTREHSPFEWNDLFALIFAIQVLSSSLPDYLSILMVSGQEQGLLCTGWRIFFFMMYWFTSDFHCLIILITGISVRQSGLITIITEEEKITALCFLFHGNILKMKLILREEFIKLLWRPTCF